MKRKKTNLLSEKKRRKLSKKYLSGGGESQYAKKYAYLNSTGLWGWEVPEPKPWKSKKVKTS